MNLGVIGQATGLFAVTNIDDILILALFFAQSAGRRGAAVRIVAGQYVGFVGIVVVAVAAAFGATFLPAQAVPYLGLLPLALGVKAAWQAWQAWQAWRSSRERRDDTGEAPAIRRPDGPRAFEVAAVTFANGGDNIGVYVPVFATAGVGATTLYVTVFLALVGIWCLAGRYFATRPFVATTLSRCGHILLPLVLVGVGVLILVEGGVIGL
ncbi:cadmium resistance transporter [Spongiactinospora sp. 9N601]|uniref:cadmium resistance transporter n=1 Tax=Spongiactinospora sp. 9N601 TaxID=3375149 RepID=UPI0037B74F8C